MHELVNQILVTAKSIHKARQVQVNEFANVSRITLLAYDILLNLDREKRLVWDDGFRASTILYYILRYPVIAFQIFTLLLAPNLPHCNSMYKFTFTLSITLTRIALCTSFVMRVYAVLPKGIFCYLSTALLSAIGTLSIVLDVIQTTEVSCSQSSSPIWLVLTFITLICFDVTSTALMSWGIFQIVRSQGMRHLDKWRLPAIILKSGILYYLIITGLQLGAVILYWLPQGVFSLVLNNYLTPLSTILVSHFLLDLREAMHGDDSPDQSTNLQDMQFAAASAVGRDTYESWNIQSTGRPERIVDSDQKQRDRFGLYRDFQFEARALGEARS